MTSPDSKLESQQGPIVSAREARQGATGHNVRYVLGFSLVALIIAFVIILLSFFA